ncbi:uncharacterized protein LOC120088335 isoform X2 [Benincasa hispida]|uniref:uncharacterized protein LOC120088335 isoform X2 n=1 Tax=Benincasa hispida TaxID=102211 RepID=UPI0018FFC559|nr:uncharacterized protein LOC120088335 isoform X2 [Benincasa hispida]
MNFYMPRLLITLFFELSDGYVLHLLYRMAGPSFNHVPQLPFLLAIHLAKSTLKTIGRDKQHDGLYLLENPYEAVDFVHASSTINVVSQSSTELWHSRLGHPSLSRLSALKIILSLPFHYIIHIFVKSVRWQNKKD